MRRCVASVVLFSTLAFSPTLSGSELAGYFRYPAIHGDTVVFTSEGDLWRVAATGGLAARLTTHAEQEARAAISPDGTLVAFSASYDGPTEIYVMPIDGGRPTRVTYDGDNANVVGWTPDGRIIYSTRHFSTLPNTQLVIVDKRGTQQTLLPLEMACEASMKPDGLTIFFARTTPQGGAVKRYKGGTAQQLWRYKLGDEEAVPLTTAKQYAGASREPMWWQSRLYFLTDRDGIMNIWSMTEDGNDLKQHTQQKLFDIQSPSLQSGQIVYQCGADLYVFDISSGESRKLDIRLTSDFDQTREKWVDDPFDYLSSIALDKEGKRLALTCRGNIFVKPVEDGRMIRVTRKPGVRHRSAIFSADGRSVFALSDELGEFEYWSFAADGEPTATQITDDADVLRIGGVASTDGKYIAFTDKNWRLWLVDVDAKTTKMIYQSPVDSLGGLSWSPDSRWLAFVSSAANTNNQVQLYDVTDGACHIVTGDRVNSYSPAWDPGGDWLFFLSDRHLVSRVSSPWGHRQPEPFIATPTKIYMLALRDGLISPFLPENELTSAEDEKLQEDEPDDEDNDEDSDGKQEEGDDGDEEKEPKEDEPSAEVKIEFDGLDRRLFVVPTEPGRYSGLSANSKRLFWVSYDAEKRQSDLMSLEIARDKKPSSVIRDMSSYEVSADGKKMMVRRQSAIHVFKTNTESPNLDKSRVRFSNWRFAIEPREEWRQMFVDAWRMERDYFYDRGMHGIDWQNLLDRYLPLVDRVNDRAELSNVMFQLVGELEALHISVRGGDHRQDEQDVSLASLGAVLTRDEAAGGYRVDRIYENDPDYPEGLAPLARPEVAVSRGDVILSVNRVPLLSVGHPQILLRNQADRQVLLSVKDAKTSSHRDVIVVPMSMRREANLRYSDWEYTRRKKVEQQSDAQIGYVHLRAMSGSNYTEFVRNFYPVFRRQGLIVDMRHNRGGNIDSWILEKLMRKAWFYWQPRVGQPYWNMQYAFRGHMVVLCDEYTASDGEAFTEGFRRLGLGKVIGKRTWGGEIWLSSSNRLVDHGIATAAEYGVYGPEREWLIEGHGVVPDIVVDNLPHATFGGKDQQLETAIGYLLEKIKTDPVPVPKHPDYPDKTKD